jgi:predicted transcriptional regulator of viral defense system
VKALDALLERRLSRKRPWFAREEALKVLPPARLTAALSELIRKGRLANPRPGFYLILSPEDKGAPEPGRWINALMHHQGADYRISLLTAAKHHGASTEPASFQLVVPKALRDFSLGRHRIEFAQQPPNAFTRTNKPQWLEESKPGRAKLACLELALLDCARWFHKAGGISRVAQVVRELGQMANDKRLAAIARGCENADVMRLGYLLELAGHDKQANALEPYAEEAKQVKLLDPTSAIQAGELSGRWKITLNTPPK